ncbi:MAG: hypothetical protein FWE95_04390 [Planctomycetaceae bacterium]|nr:hypothetical protein [Planctomycetaceae bacterium]
MASTVLAQKLDRPVKRRTVVRPVKMMTDAVAILQKRFGSPESDAYMVEKLERILIGNQIYDLRTQAGMTQAALARKVGTKAALLHLRLFGKSDTIEGVTLTNKNFMKTKLVLIAVACLFLFSPVGQAQMMMMPPDFASQDPERMKVELEKVIRSFWEGRAATMMVGGFVGFPEIRAAWDITDEQYQRIQNPFGPGLLERPEFMELEEKEVAFNRILRESRDSLGQDAIEEIQQKLLDIQDRRSALMTNVAINVINDLLTPEQKQKIRESWLASMGEMPFILPVAFEALHLTDAQKQQMGEIKKELEPEFEKHLEKFVEGQMILSNKMSAELRRLGSQNFRSPEAMLERMQATARQLAAQDPEFKRVQGEMTSLSQTFSTQFRTRMFDVLTDAQWLRLQELNDNPPEYVLAIRKRLREMRGDSEQADGEWVPGPGSWQPGDAIPIQYRQERNERSRFPRREN